MAITFNPLGNPFDFTGGGSTIANGSANQIYAMNPAGDGKEWKTFLGTGSQVTVTPGSQTMTFSTPQNIAPTSDVTFASVNNFQVGASYGAGTFTVPTITIAADGTTASASSVVAALYSGSAWSGTYNKYTIAAQSSLALTDNSSNYLIVDYNAGSPIYTVTTDPANINSSNKILVSNMYRSGSEVHYVSVNWGEAPSVRLINRLINTQRFERSSGLTLTETATRIINISSGVVWYGTNNITGSAVNSSSNNAVLYYRTSGSVWNTSTISDYNNTQYNDTTTGLTSLTGNRFNVNWIYRFIDGDSLAKIAVVLSTSEYNTLAEAAVSTVPLSPTILQRQAILVGRIIVQQNNSTASQIDSSFSSSFIGAAVSEHNNLGGLQGGSVTEYYHLTSPQHTIATQAATGSTSGYLTSGDWTTFNNKENALTKGSVSSTTITVGGVGQIIGSGLTLELPQALGSTSSPTFALATIGSVAIPTMMTDTQEATGWLTTTGTLAFDDSTQVFTMTGTDSYYIKGKKYSVTNISKTIGSTSGLHFIYYDHNNVVQEGAFPGTNYVLIASVYYNATTAKGLLANERHGCVMDWSTHSYLHNSIGCRYESGLTGTFTNTTFSIGSGNIWDEDLKHVIGSATTCTVMYKNGTTTFEWDANNVTPYKEVSTVIQYNNVNALAPVSTSNYVAYWIFATNDIVNPIVSIMGQRQDTSIANARTNNTYETLSFGSIPYQEMKLLYRVIYRNVGGVSTYQEIADYRAVSNLPGGTFTATAHSTLTGLTSGDDHTQYAYLAGRSGGQILISGTDASNNLILRSTSNATKGKVYLDETTEAVTLSSASFVTDGGLSVAKNIAVGSGVGFYSNSQVTTLKGCGSASSSVTYELPITDGSASQVLTTAGNGKLSWVTVAPILNTVTKTGSATLSAAEFDGIVLLDGTSTVVPITFPAANTVTGKICRLKVINATNTCSLLSTVDGTAGYDFTGIYDKANCFSDGTNFWFI